MLRFRFFKFKLSAEERIVHLFIADSRFVSMSGIYYGIVRQDKKFGRDAFSQVVKVSSFQVCASDASFKQGVPAEKAALFLAVEDHASRRMPRNGNCFQFRFAEADDFSVGDAVPQWFRGFVDREAE